MFVYIIPIFFNRVTPVETRTENGITFRQKATIDNVTEQVVVAIITKTSTVFENVVETLSFLNIFLDVQISTSK